MSSTESQPYKPPISFPMFLFLCFAVSCLVVCVLMLTVGVANGNISRTSRPGTRWFRPSSSRWSTERRASAPKEMIG